MCVPDLSVMTSQYGFLFLFLPFFLNFDIFPPRVTLRAVVTYAEKSAAAVAAIFASADKRACQTAPLWPTKVPILIRLSLQFHRSFEGYWDNLPIASDTVTKHRIIIYAKEMNEILNFGTFLRCELKTKAIGEMVAAHLYMLKSDSTALRPLSMKS